MNLPGSPRAAGPTQMPQVMLVRSTHKGGKPGENIQQLSSEDDSPKATSFECCPGSCRQLDDAEGNPRRTLPHLFGSIYSRNE